MFEESMQLMEDCFKQYEMKNLLKIDDVYHTIKIKKGKNKFVQAQAVGNICYPLKKDGSEDEKIKIITTLPQELPQKITVGQIVGKIDILFDNQLIFNTNICI